MGETLDTLCRYFAIFKGRHLFATFWLQSCTQRPLKKEVYFESNKFGEFLFLYRVDPVSVSPKCVSMPFNMPSVQRRDISKHITKTWLFKYTENFTTKNESFQIKKSDIFHISAKNIDCGYPLEPPRRGGSNVYNYLCFWAEIRKIIYTPVNPCFLYKSGVEGGQNYIGMFSWWVQTQRLI